MTKPTKCGIVTLYTLIREFLKASLCLTKKRGNLEKRNLEVEFLAPLCGNRITYKSPTFVIQIQILAEALRALALNYVNFVRKLSHTKENGMISKDQVDMYKEQLDNKSEDSVDFDTLEAGINIGVSLLEQYFEEKHPEMSGCLLEKRDEVEEFIQKRLNDIVTKAIEETLPDEG